MKAYLLFRDRNYNIKQPQMHGKDFLTSDLELKNIIAAMSKGDDVIAEVSASVLFCPLQNPADIKYRQDVLQDCIKNSETVRAFYSIAIETLKRESKSFSWLSTNQSLTSIFSSAANLLRIFMEMLLKLRQSADAAGSNFTSKGFCDFLAMLKSELSDDFFKEAEEHLSEIKHTDGMVISSRLGSYNQGTGYVLRRRINKNFWVRWKFAPSFTLAPRDDTGFADFAKRKERAINESANVLAQSANHIQDFFTMLRNELAFFIGCLNLYDCLHDVNLPVCMPSMKETDKKQRIFKGLYDVSLALTIGEKTVGNDLDVSEKELYIITGANQGGKTTFLRSIGQAQLMMQCGMFVPAQNYFSHLCSGLFTHFKKEEDKSMSSGKLDEELIRMSDIVNHLHNGALILLNESFAATNEREGAEICRQITQALIENGIEVFSVTHLFTYAETFYKMHLTDSEFLRAERHENGDRTFKIIEGKPLQTAFGMDLYQKYY
ncbi:MAG: MutS-related protein [Eubacteriales bacterium]